MLPSARARLFTIVEASLMSAIAESTNASAPPRVIATFRVNTQFEASTPTTGREGVGSSLATKEEEGLEELDGVSVKRGVRLADW